MAKDSLVQQAASLRALTYRIASCPPKQLPHIAPQIAASLWNCRAILIASADSAKANSEASQTVNRFRASVSQLLQARSVEEKWAAVVLAKAAIEAGGLEIVSKATGWTKNLVALLKKNDPPSTKVLAVITLTRIFMLTWEDANLVREITTPALPGFVQACLTAVEKDRASGHVLQTTLEAFATLVPRHPTIFRTYEGQIRTLLLKILSATASASNHEQSYTERHQDSARRVFVLLYHCAPKQGVAEKWDETLTAAVTAAHITCDRIFRSVNESWKSNAGITKTAVGSAGDLQMSASDAVGLTPWQGIHAGSERLATLIQLLQGHMQCATSSVTTIKIGLVFDLLSRVLELHTSARDQPASFNAQISKDEREELFNVLPGLHVAAIGLLRTMVQRFGQALVSTFPNAVDLLSAVFTSESSDVRLREAAYRILHSILGRIGPSMSKNTTADITSIMGGCCEDLLPVTETKNQISGTKPEHDVNGNTTKSLSHTADLPGLQAAASALLPLLLTKLDQSLLPARLRVRMEQTAVLTRHKDALVACVLNPPKKRRDTALRASLLPLIAREFPDCAEVEALLRPRMPMIGIGGGGKVGLENGVEDEEDSESSEEDEEGEDEDKDGIGQNGTGDEIDAENTMTALSGSTNEAPAGLARQDDTVNATIKTADEVFSTAPEQATDLTSIQQSNKRRATDEASNLETLTKRPRASPVAASLVAEAGQDVPGPASDTGPTAAATVTAIVGEFGDVQAAVLPASAVTGVGDSDDSDFEIPPLTMESDSEEEV